MISEAEIGELFREEWRNLVGLAYRDVGGLGSEGAEDAVMFAFEQLLRYRAHVEASNLFGWVLVVARREGYLIVRRRRLRRFPDAELDHLDDSYHEARELVERALSLRRGRAIAMVARLLGLTYKELQAATGESYTWVNRHTAEGRAELRELLEAA